MQRRFRGATSYQHVNCHAQEPGCAGDRGSGYASERAWDSRVRAVAVFSENGAWRSPAEGQSKLMSPIPSLAEPESRRQLLRHLAEAAFLACMTNDVVRARRIAKGLEVVAPGGRECVIAYVLSDLVANDVDAALERLRPLASANDPYGMAFQVLALGIAGRLKEQDEVLRRLPHDDPALDELLTVLRNPVRTHPAGIPANEQRV